MMRLGLGKLMRRAWRAVWHSSSAARSTGTSEPEGPLAVRRWEAADTNRLNRAQWARATGFDINADLASDLETIRTRAIWESSRNPTIEGMLRGFGGDLAGPHGPMLVVTTEDQEYAKALRAVWWDWALECEIAGKLGIADLIKLWTRNLFLAGELVAQRVTKRRNAGPVTMRLKTIHPRRLGTPPGLSGDPDVCLGVRRTSDGEPLAYYFAEPLRMGPYTLGSWEYTEVPAAAVFHEFITIEDDQARGVPWLSTPLQSAADLREYDHQVLDAARAAADNATVLYTDHPDANYIEVNESTEVERRTISHLPPGWKATQLKAEQPTTNYVDYRSERQRELGQPVKMPLLMLRMGAERHNYSSARFDGKVYERGIIELRAWLERRILNKLVLELQREAELYAAAHPEWPYAKALRRRPADVVLSFTWAALPTVDPEKDASAEETELRNGTKTFTQACAAKGLDVDEQIQDLAKVRQKFLKAGLPVPTWGATPIAAPADPDPDPDPNAEPNGDGEDDE